MGNSFVPRWQRPRVALTRGELAQLPRPQGALWRGLSKPGPVRRVRDGYFQDPGSRARCVSPSQRGRARGEAVGRVVEQPRQGPGVVPGEIWCLICSVEAL